MAPAASASPGQDMRCTLTSGGGGPDTRPSPLVSTGAASPVRDRERRALMLGWVFAAADNMERSTDLTGLTLVPVLCRRAAVSAAFRVAARAAISAGSTSCRGNKHVEQVSEPCAT